MKNLISRKDSIKYAKWTSINLKLINKSGTFYSSSVLETGISDCQKFKPILPHSNVELLMALTKLYFSMTHRNI